MAILCLLAEPDQQQPKAVEQDQEIQADLHDTKRVQVGHLLAV